jgi:hypothetical protein
MIKAGRYDLDEASMGRIYQHVVSNPKSKSWGIVTASRGELTPAENKQRNKELENDLRKLGLGFVHVDGMWRECKDRSIDYSECPDNMKVPTEEKSYFVPNVSKEAITKLGNKYKQDSVLFADGDTKEKGEATYISAKGKEFNIGKFTAGKISQGYSKMKGDKVFTFLEPGDSGEEYKKGGEPRTEVDDVVYNTRTKNVGIVRIADERGETKTDADGNVNTDELEPFNPMKYPHQKDANIAPSTKKEVESRKLFNPFSPKYDKYKTKDEPKVSDKGNDMKLKSLLPKGVLDQMVKNPDTGKMIKVKSALKYDDTHAVKQAATNIVKKAIKK